MKNILLSVLPSIVRTEANKVPCTVDIEISRTFGNILSQAQNNLEKDFSAVGRPASADRLLWQSNARLDVI